eukprot:6180115-Pleurochrysis_carterae.AAC.1
MQTALRGARRLRRLQRAGQLRESLDRDDSARTSNLFGALLPALCERDRLLRPRRVHLRPVDGARSRFRSTQGHHHFETLLLA